MTDERIFVDYGFYAPVRPILENINAVKFIGKLQEIKDDFEKYYNSEISISDYPEIFEHYRKDDETVKDLEDLSLYELILYIELSDISSIETGICENLCHFVDYMNIPKELLHKLTDKSDDDLNSALLLSYDDEDRQMIGITYTGTPFNWNTGGYRDKVLAGYKSKEKLPCIIIETLKPYLTEPSPNPKGIEMPELDDLIEWEDVPVWNFKERVHYI